MPADELIPHPVTDIDRRVNDAYRRAIRRQKVQWVWVVTGVTPQAVVITDARPDCTAVAVSQHGWAMMVAAGAAVPWQEDE